VLTIKDSVAVITGGASGIGEAVATYWAGQGGRLVLMNLPERVRILLDVARLTPIFEVSDSKQAAIGSPEPRVPQRPLGC